MCNPLSHPTVSCPAPSAPAWTWPALAPSCKSATGRPSGMLTVRFARPRPVCHPDKNTDPAASQRFQIMSAAKNCALKWAAGAPRPCAPARENEVAVPAGVGLSSTKRMEAQAPRRESIKNALNIQLSLNINELAFAVLG